MESQRADLFCVCRINQSLSCPCKKAGTTREKNGVCVRGDSEETGSLSLPRSQEGRRAQTTPRRRLDVWKESKKDQKFFEDADFKSGEKKRGKRERYFRLEGYLQEMVEIFLSKTR